jgi:hypothetical protein
MSIETRTNLALKANIPPALLLGGNRIDQFRIYRGIGVDPIVNPEDLANSDVIYTSPVFAKSDDFPSDYEDQNVTPGETYHYVVELLRSSDGSSSISSVFTLTASGAYDLAYPNNFPDPDSGVPYYTTVEPVIHIRADIEHGKKGEGFVYTETDYLANHADSFSFLNYSFKGYTVRYLRTPGDSFKIESDFQNKYPTWSSESNYTENDLVTHNTIVYKAKQDVSANSTEPQNDSDHWFKLHSSRITNIPVITKYRSKELSMSYRAGTWSDNSGRRKISETQLGYVPGEASNSNINWYNNLDSFREYILKKDPNSDIQNKSDSYISSSYYVLNEGVSYFTVTPNRVSTVPYFTNDNIDIPNSNFKGAGRVYSGPWFKNGNGENANYYFDFSEVFSHITTNDLASYQAQTSNPWNVGHHLRLGLIIVVYHEDGYIEPIYYDGGAVQDISNRTRVRLGQSDAQIQANTQATWRDHVTNLRDSSTGSLRAMYQKWLDNPDTLEYERQRSLGAPYGYVPESAGSMHPGGRPYAEPPEEGLPFEIFTAECLYEPVVPSFVNTLFKHPSSQVFPNRVDYNYDGTYGTFSRPDGDLSQPRETQTLADMQQYIRAWSDGKPWENPYAPFGKPHPEVPNLIYPVENLDTSNNNNELLGYGHRSTHSGTTAAWNFASSHSIDNDTVSSTAGPEWSRFYTHHGSISNNFLNVWYYTYNPSADGGKGAESIYLNGNLIYSVSSTRTFNIKAGSNYWYDNGHTNDTKIPFHVPPVFHVDENYQFSEAFCEIIKYHKFLERDDFTRVLYYIKAKYGSNGLLASQSNYNGLY